MKRQSPCLSTQLIVHESQEAIFFMNGQALDLFGAGRYTLETENIPLIRKVTNLPTGGQTPFHCEVYFINKTEQMAIRWGTDSKVQYLEPTYKFPISIGASGEMSLSVSDSRKLLIKLVGTEAFLGQAKLIQFFRAFLMTRVKTYIAQTMAANAINIFEADAHLTEFSEELHKRLIPDFADYGINLNKFLVTTIVKPDGEPQYEKFKNLHFRQYADIMDAKLRQQVGVIDQQTASQRMVIEAQGIAQKRKIEGYTYQQERGFDVAEKVASNEAVGQFTNMGVGLGTMAGVGGVVGGIVGDSIQNAFGATPSQAGSPLPSEGNSFQLKTWTMTLVAAIFALSSKDANKQALVFVFIPTIGFWLLDSFYLQKEREYRILYENVTKTDEGNINFSMNTGNAKATLNETKPVCYWKCFFSTSELLFYPVLLASFVILMFVFKIL